MTRSGAVATLATILGLLCAVPAAAADPVTKKTEHTWGLGDAEPGAGTLRDVAWLVGSWEGEAFGDRFEETWNPPSNGTMVGLFKVLSGDSVAFYEIMLLVEEAGSLGLKVKHFSADFTAWEDKADFVHFRLVKIEPDAVHFSGLSFYRISPDRIDGYIAMRQKDGGVREEKLTYWRRGTKN